MELKTLILCMSIAGCCSIPVSPPAQDSYVVSTIKDTMEKCQDIPDLVVNSWGAALENHNLLKENYRVCAAKVNTTQGLLRKLEDVKIIRIITSESKGSMPGAEKTR